MASAARARAGGLHPQKVWPSACSVALWSRVSGTGSCRGRGEEVDVRSHGRGAVWPGEVRAQSWPHGDVPPPAPPLPPFDAETLREIVEHAADAIFVTGLDLRIGWVNEAAERMLGEARERILGTSVRDWLGEGEEARQPLRAKDLGEGLPTRTERRMRTADGATIAVEVSAKRPPGPFVVGIARGHRARRRRRADRAVRGELPRDHRASPTHRRAPPRHGALREPACAGVLDPGLGVARGALRARLHAPGRPPGHRRAHPYDLAAGGDERAVHGRCIVRPDGSVLRGASVRSRWCLEGVPCAVAIVRDSPR